MQLQRGRIFWHRFWYGWTLRTLGKWNKPVTEGRALHVLLCKSVVQFTVSSMESASGLEGWWWEVIGLSVLQDKSFRDSYSGYITIWPFNATKPINQYPLKYGEDSPFYSYIYIYHKSNVKYWIYFQIVPQVWERLGCGRAIALLAWAEECSWISMSFCMCSCRPILVCTHLACLLSA